MIKIGPLLARQFTLGPLLPWLLIAVMALLLAGMASGFYAGHRWATGAQARDQVKDLEAASAALLANAQQLRQGGVDAADKIHAATNRMGAIAQENEDAQARNRQFAAQQQQELARLLRDRPDLDAVDVGAQLLCHWNRAGKGGAGAAATAPGCAAQPPAGVRGSAPGSRRPPADATGQPRRQRGDRAGLQGPSKRLDQGREGSPGDRAGLVLRRSGTDGHVGRHLSAWPQVTG